MSKVVFAADIHFGVQGRLDDIVFACRAIREYCYKHKIDTVVVLGDLFHDRRHLEIDVLVAASRFFEEAADEYDQQWITFPGNHDMFLRHSWDINSLVPLKKHITVIDDVKLLQLDDRRFWVLPFIQFEKAYMKVAYKFKRRLQDGDKLLTHVGVRGATLNTCFLLKDWSIVNFEHIPFERIYTGHFHSNQKVGENIYYPGSPIPFKFDEGDIPHGFYVYDTETDEHEFVDIWDVARDLFPDEVAPPQFCTIADCQLDKLTEQDVSNNMVRIALSREYTTNERSTIKKKLRDMGARTVRWLNLARKLEDKEIRLPAYVENRDLFRSWIEADKATKDLDKRLLVQLHDEVIAEGDELYAMEEAEH